MNIGPLYDVKVRKVVAKFESQVYVYVRSEGRFESVRVSMRQRVSGRSHASRAESVAPLAGLLPSALHIDFPTSSAIWA